MDEIPSRTSTRLLGHAPEQIRISLSRIWQEPPSELQVFQFLNGIENVGTARRTSPRRRDIIGTSG
jgi:hypothetical protein